MPVGVKGPVEMELNSWGKEGRVVGLVMGGYGECSDEVMAMADLISTSEAYNYEVHRLSYATCFSQSHVSEEACSQVGSLCSSCVASSLVVS